MDLGVPLIVNAGFSITPCGSMGMVKTVTWLELEGPLSKALALAETWLQFL